MGRSPPARTVPARLAWFLQEMPALLAPLLLTLSSTDPPLLGRTCCSGPFACTTFKGGLFEYVSGANYLGEKVEWFGYAVATWSLPALSFGGFSLCFIGPRAYHRFYQEKFKDYPKLRKALIPFIF